MDGALVNAVQGPVTLAGMSRRVGGTLLASVTGALLGAGILWATRPRAGCTTFADGSKGCIPTVVEGPHLWQYVLFAMVGAAFAGGAAYIWLSRRAGRR